MPGGVIGTGQFPEFLEERRESLQVAINTALEQVEYPLYTTDKGTAKLITERMQHMEPMQALARWYENTDRPRMTVKPGWAHLISQMQIGGEVVITKAMQRFQTWDVLNQGLTQMKRSSILALEYLFINYLTYGEDTTAPVIDNIPVISHTCPDGLPLFSLTHSWRQGGAVLPNMSASLDAISDTAIFTINGRVRRWAHSNGDAIGAKLDSMLIPVELERLARIWLMTDRDPLTSNNAINTATYFLPGSYKVLNFLTSATEWFVKTDQTDLLPMILWGWKLETSKRLPDTDSASNSAVCVDLSVAHAAPLMPLGIYKVTAG